MNKNLKRTVCMAAIAAFTTLFAAGSAHAADAKTISIDGSSTVYPITEAVAEQFRKTNPEVRVTVGISGTGGGFKKFVVGEIDIADASRPITNDEIALTEKNKISFIELPVAYDGLAVMVNPKNDFVSELTVDELKRIWQPESTVKLWSDVRPTWPKRKIKLYGPGTDSGTFDYFTKAIVGKEKSCRADFTASEDDNMLVQGIAGDKDALGYFGYAYYVENKARLKLVGVNNGKTTVLPTEETINNGTYAPLSRPIFIYVSKKAAQRPEVDSFVKFYLSNTDKLSKQVGYVPLHPAVTALASQRYSEGTLGSAFASHGSQLNVKLEEIFANQSKGKKAGK